MNKSTTKIFFTDAFNIPPEQLEDYGALNISLFNDLPLYIDPFLLFNSKNAEYQMLHAQIIRYLKFLHDKSLQNLVMDEGLLRAWYTFPEIKQTWLGVSQFGNQGRGLGIRFAKNLHQNLNSFGWNFGNETISAGSHIEKLALFDRRIGHDSISDFTTNLVYKFLLDYTQIFAQIYLTDAQRELRSVRHVEFNYSTETWETGTFELPIYREDFVVLVPKNILTRERTWISRDDMRRKISVVANTISNDQLRAQINNYLATHLDPLQKLTARQKNEVISQFMRKFPEFADYYVRYQENHGDDAENLSNEKVWHTVNTYEKKATELLGKLDESLSFRLALDSKRKIREWLELLKKVIRNEDNYLLLYTSQSNQTKPISSEKDLQLFLRMVGYAYQVDHAEHIYKLVEFKLGSNPKLAQFLRKFSYNQLSVEVVIVIFDNHAAINVKSTLNELSLTDNDSVILIDARPPVKEPKWSLLDIQEVNNCLLNAFDNNSLTRMLRTQFDKELTHLVPQGSLQDVVSDLVACSRREGWLLRLISASAKFNHSNESLSKFANKFVRTEL